MIFISAGIIDQMKILFHSKLQKKYAKMKTKQLIERQKM